MNDVHRLHADASSGLSPTPVAEVPVQATVLCSRLATVNTSQAGCSLNVTQLALLKTQDQPTSVLFETTVTFNSYPWPSWSNATAVNGSVLVDQGVIGSMLCMTCEHMLPCVILALGR